MPASWVILCHQLLSRCCCLLSPSKKGYSPCVISFHVIPSHLIPLLLVALLLATRVGMCVIAKAPRCVWWFGLIHVFLCVRVCFHSLLSCVYVWESGLRVITSTPAHVSARWYFWHGQFGYWLVNMFLSFFYMIIRCESGKHCGSHRATACVCVGVCNIFWTDKHWTDRLVSAEGIKSVCKMITNYYLMLSIRGQLLDIRRLI